MKKILLITTGGTIASLQSDSGLTPGIDHEELMSYVPELKDICKIEAINLFSLDSSNIGPKHWIRIVETIRDNYVKYDGFVITHGTDTMAYTAAALSYMIQNPDKPIVLTGSQKSIYNRDSDARNNMIRAFSYASSDEAWGVEIVFDTKVILGTRARKTKSKSYNAFSSINYPNCAVYRDEKLIPFLPRPQYRNCTRFYTELNEKVYVLRLVPGMSAKIFDFVCEQYDALIIEGYGVGGFSSADSEMVKGLKKWADTGKVTIFSTQVINEGSDLSVYEAGRIARDLPNVIESNDMTPEAIVAKTMWALGQGEDTKEVISLFETPVHYDRF